MSALTRPDALVLGAGGTLGIHWLRAVLAGVEAQTGWDLTACDYFVGTSAGSVVAAGLAGGQRPDAGGDAAHAWAAAAPDGVPATPPPGPARSAARWLGAAVAPFAPLALSATAPGGAAIRAAVLATAPRPRRNLTDLGRAVDDFGGTFDGRLRIATVDRRTGRRVMFGEPSAPTATVSQAVTASCSIPWVFSPVHIAGREYVDGGVWSLTNLDALPAGRGSEVLCLVPTGAAVAARSPLGALRAATHAALLAELLVMRTRGARVRVVTPDAASAEAMGVDLMDGRRTEAVLGPAYAQGRALANG